MKSSLLPTILLLFTGTSANLLESYQQRFINYSASIDDQLLHLRSTHGTLGLHLNHQTLRNFSSFILEMRQIADDAWRFIEDFETDSDWCKDYIRTIYDVYVEIGENDIKTCAARWTRSIEQDASERFWPVAKETQRWGSDGLSRVLWSLGQVERMLDWEEVQKEIEGSLEEFGEGWIQRWEQMEDDLGRHDTFEETILAALADCVEEAIFWNHIFMDYAMDMVYLYC